MTHHLNMNDILEPIQACQYRNTDTSYLAPIKKTGLINYEWFIKITIKMTVQSCNEKKSVILKIFLSRLFLPIPSKR